MANSDLKQRVLEYVQEADEPLLQLMESLAQNYRKETSADLTLTEDDLLNGTANEELLVRKLEAGEQSGFIDDFDPEEKLKELLRR